MSLPARRIAILGSTGSIGTQALDVIAAQPGKFEVEVLTAQNNAELLVRQALAFRPASVVIGDLAKYAQVRDALAPADIKVFAGPEALEQIVESDSIDIVLTALVGAAGLRPTLRAIRSGRQIALANKETLVVAGELVTRLARENGVNIYPVDSEHSAIFQCLAGEWHNPLEKVYLTASGGPFRGHTREMLKSVTRDQALRHPNWTMGAKITIDSSTLMNKGLEVIEAGWLFHLRPEQIEVVVHPQSIIHSIAQFADGSMKAQMGLPDMKLPILYALSYPGRLETTFPRFSFLQHPQLTFETPDTETFRCLELAFMAMRAGGNAPCVLNAANEVAVELFLENRIGFLRIPEVIEETLNRIPTAGCAGLEDYLLADEEARRTARALA